MVESLSDSLVSMGDQWMVSNHFRILIIVRIKMAFKSTHKNQMATARSTHSTLSNRKLEMLSTPLNALKIEKFRINSS
jgi:hypothetical protein